MKKYRFIFLLVIIFCIILILFSVFSIFRGRIMLIVNKENRQLVLECLEDEGDLRPHDAVRKVAYGSFWLDTFIYVYYWSGRVDSIVLVEGCCPDNGEVYLHEYIKENGYREDYVAKWIIGLSSIILTSSIIGLIVIKYHNKMKLKN